MRWKATIAVVEPSLPNSYDPHLFMPICRNYPNYGIYPVGLVRLTLPLRKASICLTSVSHGTKLIRSDTQRARRGSGLPNSAGVCGALMKAHYMTRIADA